jgi:hypothetical protein
LRQEKEEDKKSENSRSNKEESILFSGLKRSAISRPSATQDQLHVKHTRESKKTKQEKVRTKLFRLY